MFPMTPSSSLAVGAPRTELGSLTGVCEKPMGDRGFETAGASLPPSPWGPDIDICAAPAVGLTLLKGERGCSKAPVLRMVQAVPPTPPDSAVAVELVPSGSGWESSRATSRPDEGSLSPPPGPAAARFSPSRGRGRDVGSDGR